MAFEAKLKEIQDTTAKLFTPNLFPKGCVRTAPVLPFALGMTPLSPVGSMRLKGFINLVIGHLRSSSIMLSQG